jgi:hypothetical protein
MTTSPTIDSNYLEDCHKTCPERIDLAQCRSAIGAYFDPKIEGAS